MTQDPDSSGPLATRATRALAWLRGFTDYEQKLHQAGRNTFDLGRMRRWCARLEHPERAPAGIHVTGTKGKSSVTAMSEALLRCAGVSTYRFLSPHLQHMRERLALQGEAVDEESFIAGLEALRPLIDRVGAATPTELPSFFETMTLLGFRLARQHGARCDVVEVGLGGRLDATNVIDPSVSVITSIALDHTRLLGDTREAIAAEKAGIIKPHRPLVLGLEAGDPARDVIEAVAREREAPLLTLEKDVLIERAECMADRERGPRVRVSGTVLGEASGEAEIVGHALHDARNALMALAAARIVLRRLRIEEPPEWLDRALGQGPIIPGRSEWWPLDPPLLLDAAHTRESIAALAGILPRLAAAHGRTIVLVGLTRDRDPQQVLGSLFEHAHTVVAVPLATPRSADPESLAAAARNAGLEAHVAPDAAAGLQLARELAGSPSLIVVCGSIYLGGAVRECLSAF